jgi:hypothetical protein
VFIAAITHWKIKIEALNLAVVLRITMECVVTNKMQVNSASFGISESSFDSNIYQSVL